ncbi:MAG: hypothetical protein LVQ95_02220 [Candidatus Micrarchaeales archaeon]|nr:hypothetical protein [Candidatus Micrarchaeales archaeon]
MATKIKDDIAMKKRSVLHRFYFIGSKENADIDKLGEGLIELEPVQEVFVKDIDDGLLVKTRFFKGFEPKDVGGYIKRHVSKQYGALTGHYRGRN